MEETSIEEFFDLIGIFFKSIKKWLSNHLLKTWPLVFLILFGHVLVGIGLIKLFTFPETVAMERISFRFRWLAITFVSTFGIDFEVAMIVLSWWDENTWWHPRNSKKFMKDFESSKIESLTDISYKLDPKGISESFATDRNLLVFLSVISIACPSIESLLNFCQFGTAFLKNYPIPYLLGLGLILVGSLLLAQHFNTVATWISAQMVLLKTRSHTDSVPFTKGDIVPIDLAHGALSKKEAEIVTNVVSNFHEVYDQFNFLLKKRDRQTVNRILTLINKDPRIFPDYYKELLAVSKVLVFVKKAFSSKFRRQPSASSFKKDIKVANLESLPEFTEIKSLLKSLSITINKYAKQQTRSNSMTLTKEAERLKTWLATQRADLS